MWKDKRREITFMYGPLAIDTRLVSRNKEVRWSASTLALFLFRSLWLMQCDGQTQKSIRKTQNIAPIPENEGAGDEKKDEKIAVITYPPKLVLSFAVLVF